MRADGLCVCTFVPFIPCIIVTSTTREYKRPNVEYCGVIFVHKLVCASIFVVTPNAAFTLRLVHFD